MPDDKTAAGRSTGTQTDSPFSTIEEAIEEIRRGRMVVVADDDLSLIHI